MKRHAMKTNHLYDTVADTFVAIITPADSPATFHRRVTQYVMNEYPHAAYVITDDANVDVFDEHCMPLTSLTANC